MKKNKKKILFVIILFLTIVFIKTKVDATTISISPKQPKVGDKVTITVSVPNVHTVDVTANVTGVVSGNIRIVDGDLGGSAKSYTKSAKFECKKAGKINVTISRDSTAVLNGQYVDVSANTSVTVKDKSSNTSSDDRANNTTTASSDATLSNLGITPNDFKGFSKSTTTYNVSVPKTIEKISIYATPSDSKGATVTGAGAKTLKIGKNTFYIKVTAADKKTTKTYTLNITRKDTSTDATLSNLGIRPKEYDFTGFKPSTTDYKVEVPNKQEKITIYASRTDAEATIEGIGEKTLKLGENKFEIKVTAADKKTTKTYNLTVTRKEDEEEPQDDEEEQTASVTGVTNITVEGFSLTPKFAPETYEYSIDVPADTEKLNVEVESDKGIETEVVGNEELKAGENVITILVRDTKTDATTIYQIKANVGNTDSENTEMDLTEINSEIDRVQSNLKKRDWIIRGTIIAIIALIIIYLIQRYREGNGNYDEEEEFEEPISETKNFYEQMKEKYLDSTEDNSIEFEEPKRKGKYKGKRFK